MKSDSIKAKLRELFTEAEKMERGLVQVQIEWAELAPHEAPPDWLMEKEDELVKPFEYLAQSLFLTTVCLLDTSGLHAYLSQFYRRFGESFDAAKAAKNTDIDHYWSGEPFNKYLADLRQFLAPLDVLSDETRYLKLSGIQYLETVLRNTATIIHKGEINPTSEPDVYKAVRPVLEAIFPSAISPKSNFLKTAQEYKPDILIPELTAAVEYKYANNETKLKATIAQISDDANGYTGDTDYNLFYAVFYVTKDFWGQDKFNLAWKEKNFPQNWRAFYVVGE